MRFQATSVACSVLLISAFAGLYHAKAFRTMSQGWEASLQPAEAEQPNKAADAEQGTQQTDAQEAQTPEGTQPAETNDSVPPSEPATASDDQSAGSGKDAAKTSQTNPGTKESSDTEVSSNSENPAQQSTEAAKPTSSGQCPPEGTTSTTPDEFGNCQCKKGFKCFDMWIMEETAKVVKELSDGTADKVLNLTKADQKGKSRNCAKRAEKSNNAPEVSTVFFMHTCEHCKCFAEDPAESPNSGTPRATSLASLAVMIVVATGMGTLTL